MNNRIINIILIVVGISVLVLGYFLKDKQVALKKLPYYGIAVSDTSIIDGEQVITEKQHQVGPFSFLDQNGETITEKDIAGKVYIVDYFFTTCRSICPIMTNQMQRIYNEYKGNSDVIFLSHTVDPETDSVEVMAAYAEQKQADASQWHFLTGDKKALYDLARTGYYLDAEQGDGGPDDFIHTPNFALIDRDRHIRGFYDGTDSAEVNMLIKDIKILLAEESM